MAVVAHHLILDSNRGSVNREGRSSLAEAQQEQLE